MLEPSLSRLAASLSMLLFFPLLSCRGNLQGLSSQEYFPAQRGGERDENGLPSPVVLTSPTNAEFVHHARPVQERVGRARRGIPHWGSQGSMDVLVPFSSMEMLDPSGSILATNYTFCLSTFYFS